METRFQCLFSPDYLHLLTGEKSVSIYLLGSIEGKALVENKKEYGWVPGASLGRASRAESSVNEEMPMCDLGWKGCAGAPGRVPDASWLLVQLCVADDSTQGPDCSCPVASQQQETTVPFLGPLGHTLRPLFQPESEWRVGEEREMGKARWKGG